MTANRLSERLSHVLSMLCNGLTDREIAAELGITPALVRHHTQEIRALTGERSVSALCRQIVPDARGANRLRR